MLTKTMKNPKISTRPTLDEILAREYPFHVLADPDGGYVVVYPDLPGCSTQAETLDEIPVMADEARRLWLEVAYEDEKDIPLPSYPEEYSGKFIVRLPRSLHRELAEAAAREGMSLNSYVMELLGRRDALARVEQNLMRLQAQMDQMHAVVSQRVKGVPNGAPTSYVVADINLNAKYAEAA